MLLHRAHGPSSPLLSRTSSPRAMHQPHGSCADRSDIDVASPTTAFKQLAALRAAIASQSAGSMSTDPRSERDRLAACRQWRSRRDGLQDLEALELRMAADTAACCRRPPCARRGRPPIASRPRNRPGYARPYARNRAYGPRSSAPRRRWNSIESRHRVEMTSRFSQTAVEVRPPRHGFTRKRFIGDEHGLLSPACDDHRMAAPGRTNARATHRKPGIAGDRLTSARRGRTRIGSASRPMRYLVREVTSGPSGSGWAPPGRGRRSRRRSSPGTAPPAARSSQASRCHQLDRLLACRPGRACTGRSSRPRRSASG